MIFANTGGSNAQLNTSSASQGDIVGATVVLDSSLNVSIGPEHGRQLLSLVYRPGGLAGPEDVRARRRLELHAIDLGGSGLIDGSGQLGLTENSDQPD